MGASLEIRHGVVRSRKQHNHIQVDFEDLQGGGHNLSGQPVPMLRHAQSTEVLPGV